jgi:hypothetical protein
MFLFSLYEFKFNCGSFLQKLFRFDSGKIFFETKQQYHSSSSDTPTSAKLRILAKKSLLPVAHHWETCFQNLEGDFGEISSVREAFDKRGNRDRRDKFEF